MFAKFRQQLATSSVEVRHVHGDEDESAIIENESVNYPGVEEIVSRARVDQRHTRIANHHPKLGDSVGPPGRAIQRTVSWSTQPELGDGLASSVGTIKVTRCVHPGTKGSGRSQASMRLLAGSGRATHCAPGWSTDDR
ncbi:hypothetical protein [Nocardia thailandica]|uniref:hypothetical protein n=1 Tax=Nocardia thailandica TaxID=257275 RepID=UPI0012F95A8B|nr:hypothetical protein [Nocardia thailandica]